MRGTRLFLLLALICSVVGCSSRATSPTASPAIPTETAIPTATPTATPTHPVAPTATSTPGPTPDIVATVVAASQPRTLGPYLSPDGQWQAEVVIYDCVRVIAMDEESYEQLRLIRVDTGDEMVIDTQLLSCGGLGAAGLAGLFWSSNSRYFYYTNAREGVPDGCPEWWERPYLRFDVLNQEKSYLGSGPLSPDGTRLATWQGQELVIWDPNEGEIARAPAAVPDAMVGPIAWSPDEQSLVYLQGISESWCPFMSSRSYVVRIDLPGFEPVVLLESDAPIFGYVAWNVPGRLLLSEFDGQKWEFDLNTGQLTPVP